MRRIRIRAFTYAVHVAVWFVVVTTIVAELSPPLKAFLAGMFTHHWIAKSDLAVIIFIATALVLAGTEDPEDVTPLVKGVLVSAILGALLILVFYLLHYGGLI